MVTVIAGWQAWAVLAFCVALVLMGLSLLCLMIEIWISGGALRILLRALEERE